MLRKLLKYDFRCMFKQFAMIWPAAVAVALINCVLNSAGDSVLNNNENSVNLIFMLIFVGVMIAMAVIAAVFVITRFNSGLLRDEGYLMFTLPVKPRQLIMSKLITAMTVVIVSGIVAIISILLLSAAALNWGILLEQMKKFGAEMLRYTAENPQWIVVAAESVLAGILSVASGILLVYFAIAVGHLFSRHRIAASVIAYVLISSVGSQVLGFVVRALAETELMEWFMDTMFLFGSSFKVTISVLAVMILINLIYCAVWFFGTNYILSRKLNLE